MEMERGKDIRHLWMLGILLGGLLALSLCARGVCVHDPYETDAANALRAPCAAYLMGTDALGRCVACRILCGLKYSLLSAAAIVSVTALAGIFLGVIGAWFGRAADRTLLYLNVVFQAFPGFVLAIFIAGVLGNGLVNGVIALCVTGWTRYARFARSLTLEIVSSDYLKSARLSGLKTGEIMRKHILPNIMVPLTVMMSMSVSDAVIGIAGLSFLGIGANPPTPEWGTMMSDARSYLQVAPWTMVFPGIALFLLVIVFNVFADALQNIADPQSAKLTLIEKRRVMRKKALAPVSE